MHEVELRLELDPSLDEGFSATRSRFGQWLDEQAIEGDEAEASFEGYRFRFREEYDTLLASI